MAQTHLELNSLPQPPHVPFYSASMLLAARESASVVSGDTMNASNICTMLALINGASGGASAVRSILQGTQVTSPNGLPHWLTSAALPPATPKPAQAAPRSSSANTSEANTGLQPKSTASTAEGHRHAPPASKGSLAGVDFQSQSDLLSNHLNNRVVVEVISDSPVLRPSHDGHHWRRYGRKLIKDAKFPRLYYKCMDETCDAKKQMQVVRSEPGPDPKWVTAVTYESDHHPKCTRKDRHAHKMRQAQERAPAPAKDKRASNGTSCEDEAVTCLGQSTVVPRSDWAKSLLGFHEADSSEDPTDGESSRESGQSALSTAEGSLDADSCQKVPDSDVCWRRALKEGRRRKAQDLFSGDDDAHDGQCNRQEEGDGEEESLRRAVKCIRLFGQNVLMG